MNTADLALRNLRRNRKRTAITVASVALGILFAVVYASLEEGLRHRLETEFVGLLAAGHITLEHPGYRTDPDVALFLEDSVSLGTSLRNLPGAEEVRTIVAVQGVIKSAGGSGLVEIRGVEPSVESRTSPLPSLITSGRYLEDGDGPQIVLGERLAARLRVSPGNRVILSMADVDGLLTEVLCRVTGIFRTGLHQFDPVLAHVPLEFLREALNMPPGSATRIGVLIGDVRIQSRLVRKIRDTIGNGSIAIYPWQDMMPELDVLTRFVRTSVWILEGLLLILVLFTVWNTMLMSVLERRGEFAVQLALGTPPSRLKRMVFLETAWIAACGALLGAAAGGWLSRQAQVKGLELGWLLGDRIPFIGLGLPTTLHARVTPASLLIPAAVVFAGVLCLGVVLMRRAARTPVAESLRGGRT